MTFSDELGKPSNRRNTFVRLAPARFMNPYLTEQSPGVWVGPFSGNLFKVQVETALLGIIVFTESDSGDPDTWSYDGNTLTIHSFEISATTNLVSAFHYLTFTDVQDIELPIDPILGGETTIWEDKLKTSPQITESISNVLQGVMTVASSSISLENSDQGLSPLFSVDDSFLNKEVLIWFDVNGEKTKQFSGQIRTLDFTGTTIVLGVVDQFTSLSQPSYVGSDESLVKYSLPTYTVHPQDKNKPVPFIVGRSFNTSVDLNVLDKVSAAGDKLPTLNINPATNPQSICINYSGLPNAGKTNNREWGLCRSLGSQLINNIDFGIVTSIFSIGTNTSSTSKRGIPVQDLYFNSTGHDCEVGDSGILDANFGAGPALVPFIVYEVGSNFYRATTNLGPASGTDVRVDTLYSYSVPTSSTAVSLLIEYGDGSFFVPVASRVKNSHTAGSDFYLTDALQSDGTRKLTVVFRDNFELSATGVSPEMVKMYFNLRYGSDVQHGDLVKAVVEGAGFTVNSSSITQANSDLSSTVCVISIPRNNELEFPSVRDTLEEIMVSTLGYLTIDPEGEVSYNLFDTTGTPVGIRTDDEILSSSLSPRINYYDTQRQLTLTSDHISQENSLPFPQVLEFDKAARIHGETKPKSIKTVLDFAPSSLQNRYEKFLGNPTHTYSYKTDAIDLGLKLGDTITLQTPNLLGDLTTVDLLVIKLIKSTKSVTVTGLQII